ncbi:hypothetical protein ACFV3R_33170 [Streptomyces sp. NPDC059740]|uniref:hypothetical protein n=1 Tax=Streptomyces sp. NPDC059740 TaxID=3346926 RepID=UPI00365CB19C
MSFGDDDRYEDRYDDGYGEEPRRGRTRLRLPEGEQDGYGTARRPRSGLPGRNVVMIVGVVVLLIAAIAFANRGGSSDDRSDNTSPTSRSTAPTGVKPVQGGNGAIASGYARTEQGAQSAAANYAVALGSADMFDRAKRHEILRAVMAPSVVSAYEDDLDRAYSPAFFKNIGLNDDGKASAGQTFVSRTVPAGTKATSYNSSNATVEVWCTGLLGLAGEGSTKPVSSNWFTITMKLTYTGKDWKVVSHSQKDGPAPVNGDERASGAGEIAGAVQGFGGFTYAR